MADRRPSQELASTGGDLPTPGLGDAVATLRGLLADAEEIIAGLPAAPDFGVARGQGLVEAAREALAPMPVDSVVRTIHHFACTGGTLISKCIAALPNVQLLSEVDPLSPLGAGTEPSFRPTDLNRLLRQGPRPIGEAALIDLFKAEVRSVAQSVSGVGQRLVIRDHAHSHYCTPRDPASRPTLRQMIPSDLALASVVTVRHPLDSYASAVLNGWLGDATLPFDAYCARYLTFLDDNADLPIVKYESFVESPPATMALLCEQLQLPYSSIFQSAYSSIKLTGDSGRGGHGIAPLEPRPEAERLATVASASRAYAELCSRLAYDTRH